MVAHSNPEIAGAVADEARKAALRVPSTDAPLDNRHSISNRQPVSIRNHLKSLRINGRTLSNRHSNRGISAAFPKQSLGDQFFRRISLDNFFLCVNTKPYG
jgi:hypothetical protein